MNIDKNIENNVWGWLVGDSPVFSRQSMEGLVEFTYPDLLNALLKLIVASGRSKPVTTLSVAVRVRGPNSWWVLCPEQLLPTPIHRVYWVVLPSAPGIKSSIVVVRLGYKDLL